MLCGCCAEKGVPKEVVAEAQQWLNTCEEFVPEMRFALLVDVKGQVLSQSISSNSGLEPPLSTPHLPALIKTINQFTSLYEHTAMDHLHLRSDNTLLSLYPVYPSQRSSSSSSSSSSLSSSSKTYYILALYSQMHRVILEDHDTSKTDAAIEPIIQQLQTVLAD